MNQVDISRLRLVWMMLGAAMVLTAFPAEAGTYAVEATGSGQVTAWRGNKLLGRKNLADPEFEWNPGATAKQIWAGATRIRLTFNRRFRYRWVPDLKGDEPFPQDFHISFGLEAPTELRKEGRSAPGAVSNFLKIGAEEERIKATWSAPSGPESGDGVDYHLFGETRVLRGPSGEFTVAYETDVETSGPYRLLSFKFDTREVIMGPHLGEVIFSRAWGSMLRPRCFLRRRSA